MLPEIISIYDLPIAPDAPEEQPTIKPSFLFDFEKGDFVLQNGKLVKVYGVDALKIWIEKNVRTELDKHKVYEGQVYGVRLWDLIGQNLPQPFVESEIERELNDSLLQHSAIDSLTEFNFTREKSKLLVSFSVNLVDGTTFEQEVTY
jgi:hypothetical protein